MSEPSPPPVPDPKLPAAGDLIGVWALLAIVVAPGVVIGLSRLLYEVVRPSYLWHFIHVSTGLSMLAAVALAARSSGMAARDLGLVSARGRDLTLGLLWAVVVWVVYRFTLQLFPGPDWRPDGQWQQGPLRPAGGLSWALVMVRVVFLAFVEELAYRGYLLSVLRRMLRSTGWAVAVCTTLFAVSHVYQHAAGVFASGLAGLVFALAFLQHGRLWPGTLAHAVYNLHFYVGATEPEYVIPDAPPGAPVGW